MCEKCEINVRNHRVLFPSVCACHGSLRYLSTRLPRRNMSQMGIIEIEGGMYERREKRRGEKRKGSSTVSDLKKFGTIDKSGKVNKYQEIFANSTVIYFKQCRQANYSQ